ncbi:hypothetical protein [Microbispora hainanensis]|uniref:Secreted protein n=1 Tax=Microbispora hainanensis TaxID=568844 RepID=A0A544YV06_9ACTN|nr:hypothetical protein [Microbispora hainanensis]TQS20587.1 hypothetical protein FLX08_15655 [Microbispora hainanensis]
MRKNLAIGGLLAFVIAGIPPAASAHAAASARPAAPPIHWGPVQSRSGHHGYAKADVWLTRFTAETFVVSGALYDRDAHGGHCAYVRARFHYAGGGTGWALPKATCAPRKPIRLSSDGRITRVDVKVCVYDRPRRTTLNCYTDAITPAIIAGWPR